MLGIEKLVPTWADLEVFLQLLPRSSTAERMNPYTSMWTGVTPGDGPQEFHLVLLDNGRTDTLADPVGRQALRCIRCSACLNVCPVYSRTGGQAYGSAYPGPIGAILTPQLRGINQHPVDEQTASLPFASSLCGACYDVCPVEIDIPEVLVHLRAKVVEQQHGHPGERRDDRRWPGRRSPSRAAAAAQRVGGVLLGRSGAAAAARSGLDRRLVRRARPARRRRASRSGAGGGAPVADARPAIGPEPARGGDPATASGTRWPIARRRRRSPRDYRRDPEPGPTSVALFAERVADYRATVEIVGAGGSAGRDRGRAARPRARRIAVPADLPERWLDGARIRDRTSLARDDPPLSVADLDGADGVVTGAALGIALTGTIVLDAGAGSGSPRADPAARPARVRGARRTRSSRRCREALARLDGRRPQTWISGPSATSDIELNRVEGVHGPRRLHIIVVR